MPPVQSEEIARHSSDLTGITQPVDSTTFFPIGRSLHKIRSFFAAPAGVNLHGGPRFRLSRDIYCSIINHRYSSVREDDAADRHEGRATATSAGRLARLSTRTGDGGYR
jgi:hypothetical protein